MYWLVLYTGIHVDVVAVLGKVSLILYLYINHFLSEWYVLSVGFIQDLAGVNNFYS